MFVTVIALRYALLVSRWSYGRFIKLIEFYLNNPINLRHLIERFMSCYLQNGDRVVTIDYVTSLYPMYYRTSSTQRDHTLRYTY